VSVGGIYWWYYVDILHRSRAPGGQNYTFKISYLFFSFFEVLGAKGAIRAKG
jgi:hypothetical protein